MEMLRAASSSPLNFVPVDCQKTMLHPALIDEFNAKADLLLVGGGGMVFHRPEDDSHSGWQFNVRQEDLDDIKVPLVIYGIGFNQFYYDDHGFEPRLNGHLRATQDKAALFSVRNRGTFDELVSRGLDPARMEVIPDPGMFVPPSPIELPGIGEDEFKLGLNWAGDRAHHRFPDPWQTTRNAVIEALCQAILRLFDTLGGGKLIFIPHLSDIDSEVAPLFEERLGKVFYNVETELPYIYPPSQAQVPFLADIYRQMDLVIGMRGHANIIPLGMNTPFIGFGSHNKNHFFLDEVGEPENMISLQDYPNGCSSDEMFDAIMRVIDDKTLGARLAECRARMRAVSDAFNRKVVGLL